MHKKQYNGNIYCLFLCLFIIGSTIFAVVRIAKQAMQQTKETNPLSSSTQTTLKKTTFTPIYPQKCNEKTYETGIAYPQWETNGYGQSDTNWQTEVLAMQKDTNACWIELPLLFYQNSPDSTMVVAGKETPSLSSFSNGIQYAQKAGLHIFVTFLLGTGDPKRPWAGEIELDTYQSQQTWFSNYYLAIEPYLLIAQKYKVEQLALGTEEQWLQDNAPANLWLELFSQIRTIYAGKLTYDANWSTLYASPKSWMSSKMLSFIGISAYVPSLKVSEHIIPSYIPTLWKDTVGQALDNFSDELGSPVLISEIGYRQASDTLFNPWDTNITTKQDPEEQAAACGAAIANTIHDPHILGIFFWGWNDVGGMNLKDTQAAKTIATYYKNK